MQICFLLLIVPGVIGLLLICIFLGLHHPELVSQLLHSDTKSNHFFGFYPLSSFYWGLYDFSTSIFLFLPIVYIIEKNPFWSSVKKSCILFFKNLTFVLPLSLFSLVMTSSFYLFVPSGNYIVYPLLTMVNSFVCPIYMMSLFFFYKKKCKIQVYEEKIKKRKKVNKLAIGSMVISIILLVEVDIFLAYVFLTTLFNWGDTVVSAYLFAAIITLIILLILRIYKYSVKKLGFLILISIVCLIAIIVFGAFAVGKNNNNQQSNNNNVTVERQFSSDELWNAVNDIRKRNGVSILKKNKWACQVAQTRLVDNLKIGNGYLASEESYDIAIQKAIKTYETANASDKNEPMPEFSSEYMFNAANLEEGIKLFRDDKYENKLFTRGDIVYGCAAAKKGYGVVITTFDPLFDPSSEEVTSL